MVRCWSEKAQCNFSSHDWFSFHIYRQQEALLLKTVFYFVRECTTRQLQSWVITQAHRSAEEERVHTWFHQPFIGPDHLFLPLPFLCPRPLTRFNTICTGNIETQEFPSSHPDEHHVGLWRYHRTELWYCRLLCVWRLQIHLSLLISRFSHWKLPCAVQDMLNECLRSSRWNQCHYWA